MSDGQCRSAVAVVELSRTQRGVLIAFGLIGTILLIVISSMAATDGVWAVAVVGALFLVVLVGFDYRAIRMSLTVYDGELLVRNLFQTRRVSREEIADLYASPAASSPFRGNIWFTLRDGSILPIDIAGRRMPLTAKGLVTLEKRRSLLRQWFSGANRDR